MMLRLLSISSLVFSFILGQNNCVVLFVKDYFVKCLYDTLIGTHMTTRMRLLFYAHMTALSSTHMSDLLVFSAKIEVKHSKIALFYSKLGVLIRVKTSSSHKSRYKS